MPRHRSMNVDVDTDQLIKLVEAHPAIWDRSLQAYKSRACTGIAWHSVCEQLNPDFPSLKAGDKNEYVKRILSKWRNVRDQWLKRCRAVATEKVGGKPAKHYYYFDQLMFLLKCNDVDAAAKPHDYTEDDRSLSPEVFNYAPDMPQPQPQPQPQFQTQTTAKRTSVCEAEPEWKRPKLSVEEDDRERRERTVLAPMIEEDPMLSFFKGILPSTRDFSDDETLEFQAGVLALVQNIKRSRVYLGSAMAEKWPPLSAADSSQQPGSSSSASVGSLAAAIVKQDFGDEFD